MWPGDGWANIEIAAAAVGLPRRASTTLTWLPFGDSPAPALADPAVQLVEIHRRSSSWIEIEHDAQRLARAHQREPLLDLVERQPVRDETVERQAAGSGRGRA